MPKVSYYVIYSEEQTNLKEKSAFTPVLSFSAPQIELVGTGALFNTQKASEKLNRKITTEEIAHTLSHIKCWKAIAENETLQDEDFALIAESAVNLVEDFQRLAQDYANKYPSYGIIKLQHSGECRSGERLFQTGDEPDALIYGDTNQYNHGCSLYLIRKDLAKKLTALLTETKPYWLADQFTIFHEPKNIAQARYLLGETPSEKQQEKIDNPLFSIIVPIYNVERYLEQCIESVLAQDFHNYELILVDDGSPDNSIDICLKYAKKYKNIVFIHKTNGGLSDARNAGIQIARGEYLMFLDSDDYWEGTQILSDLASIAHKKPDVIINDCTFFFTDGKKETYPIKKDDLTFNYFNDFETLVSRNIYRPAAWSKVVRRNFLLDNHLFFPKGKNHEDLDWSFELAKYIKSYAIYDSYFYIYRTRRKGSITEFVKRHNTEDLLDISFNRISQLKEIKEKSLYEGLKKYILKQSHYIKDSFHLLNEQDKNLLQDKFTQFEQLIKALTQ